MGESRLSAEDIRAAAEVHGELGPEYRDAVVESFLARIDQHIDARVEQQLAGQPARRRRPVDPVRLGKYRTALAGSAAGSVVVGVPLTALAWRTMEDAGHGAKGLLVLWVVILVAYGAVAYRLRRR
jgi:hypothetical protein